MPMSLRLALRRLAKNPAFCLISILMLALGVAVSTLTFSITSSTLLRPLPFPHPDRLLRVFATSTKDAFMPLAPGDALDIRDQLGDIGQFALFAPQSFNVGEPGETPQQKPGLSVTANFLDVLGVRPALGRGFLPNEDEVSQANVTVITHAFWEEHFGGDPHVLGKALRIETTTYTIVGVLPPSFDEALLWRGRAFVHVSSAWRGWRANHSAHWMNLVCRLNPGVTVPQANLRLLSIAATLAREHPAEVGSNGLRFTPLGTSFVRARSVYWLIVGLAVFVLVIACANLGALQLARALERRGELAVRSALGATRANLIAALAVESVVIALAGTALGVVAIGWGRALIIHALGMDQIVLDWRVILFDGLLATLAVVVFGLLPAVVASDLNTSEALKASGRSTTSGRQQRRVKSALIVAQISLAVVLVSTAFSFVVGVRTFIQRDRGWQPDGLVSGLLHAPWGWMQKEATNPTLTARLRAQLTAIPGVEAASVSSGGAIYGGTDESKVFVEGAPPTAPGQEPRALLIGVDASFFHVLQIPIRAGRLLADNYRRSDPPIAVVSVSFAHHFWPDGSALGKRVKFGENQPWREIVGIVGDVSLAIAYDRATPTAQAYIPSEDTPGPWYNFIVRSSLPALALEHPIRQAVAGIDPDFMVMEFGDVPTLLQQEAGNRLLTVSLTTFAAAGLLIALIGLYGMMTEIVNARRREIGVRLALGADGRRIIAMIMASGAWLIAVGTVIGAALAWIAAGFLLRGMPELPVPGLGARLVLALVLMVVGAAACFLPSRRASRLNPVEVLRAE